MTALPTNSGVSTSHQFKRQLEIFCRTERISTDETRQVGKTIVERVCRAHSGEVVFSPGGCKVPVSVRLGNGATAKMLIVFDEFVPGCRAIQKILSARVVRKEPQVSPAQE